MAARARAMRDEIQRLLRERADPTRKAGMDRYFKGAIRGSACTPPKSDAWSRKRDARK